MKKRFLSLAFSVVLLAGCSSNLVGQANDAPQEKTKQQIESTVDGAKSKTEAPKAESNTTSTPKQPAEKATTPATKEPKQQATQQQPSKQTAASQEPAKKTTTSVPTEQIDFNKVSIDCDISEQMVYVKQDGNIVRAMPTSSGLDIIPDNSTPRGEFVIEPERGTWFFTPQYEEGAKYWVSFKNHGEFLFHSVVMDKNQQIIESEAKKIGTKASHGCFRMLLDDAKWIYDNIKTGTKVSIHE